MEVCTTHLIARSATNDAYWRRQQIDRVVTLAKNYGAARGILIGGDFNQLPPGEALNDEMDPLYATLGEVDQYYSPYTTNFPNSKSFSNDDAREKLDYIFFGRARVASPDGDVIEPVRWGTQSGQYDHRFIPALNMRMN